MTSTRCLSMSLALLAVIPSGAIAQTLPAGYTFVPLNRAGEPFSRAWAVNDAGQVALESGQATGTTRAFRWQGGTFTDLGTLGGPNASVRAINSEGVVVGSSWSSNSIFAQDAYRAAPGQPMQLIPRPPGSNVNNFATGINDSGLVIGNANRPWTWTASGGFTLLTDLSGGSSASANGLNNAGLVVGSSSLPGNLTRAVLWRPDGSITNLGALSTINSPISIAFDISESGVVVGYSGDFFAFSRAFRWTEAGGMEDLGAPGNRSSFANAINDSGLIVGYATFDSAPLQRAHIWTGPNQAVDLNTFLPPGSGWTLNEAYGINNQGWIVGRGSVGTSTSAAWLLIPITPACYANCDGSTGTPVLSPADFVCFLNKYRAGDPYANCDGSTGTPALTPADFVCFLNAYRAGC